LRDKRDNRDALSEFWMNEIHFGHCTQGSEVAMGHSIALKSSVRQ
jgi:hypothetical protein